MNSYVEINKVTKYFSGSRDVDGSKPVLDQLSLQVKEGELVTLLGPSGCGKSTLLRCIAGLTDYEEGDVHLDGQDLAQLEPKRRQVGMVFQSYALFPNMTVYDNIAFGLVMQRLPRKEITQRTMKMLELIDMTDKSTSYPHQLSGGQQQRVALARSLAIQPKLMLMDEPLSALDAKIRKHLRAEIRRIQRELGMTTIFVTHDQEEALTLSDRICVMHEGRIEQVGTPEEVYARPLTTFVAKFIGNYNVLSGSEMASLIDGSDLPPPVSGAAKAGIAREEIAAAAAGRSSSMYERSPSVAYAIRPEAIQILDIRGGSSISSGLGEGTSSELSVEQFSRAYIVEATATDSVVLGALLRYTVEARGISLIVDALNIPGQRRMPAGSSLRLLIPRDACLSLMP
nr:ABC transporter ATP-binding protein [Paenibacillus baekrokdamisoli]